MNNILNRRLQRLKHLQGQHNQLDHAWNRGMGGGGDVVSATNSNNRLPFKPDAATVVQNGSLQANGIIDAFKKFISKKRNIPFQKKQTYVEKFINNLLASSKTSFFNPAGTNRYMRDARFRMRQLVKKTQADMAMRDNASDAQQHSYYDNEIKQSTMKMTNIVNEMTELITGIGKSYTIIMDYQDEIKAQAQLLYKEISDLTALIKNNPNSPNLQTWREDLDEKQNVFFFIDLALQSAADGEESHMFELHNHILTSLQNPYYTSLSPSIIITPPSSPVSLTDKEVEELTLKSLGMFSNTMQYEADMDVRYSPTRSVAKGKYVNGAFKGTIDIPETKATNTVVHEMIHVATFQNQEILQMVSLWGQHITKGENLTHLSQLTGINDYKPDEYAYTDNMKDTERYYTLKISNNQHNQNIFFEIPTMAFTRFWENTSDVKRTLRATLLAMTLTQDTNANTTQDEHYKLRELYDEIIQTHPLFSM